MQYFRLGTQYYVAGRYAALVWLMPVAGNLLHHAIEMCLKGSLAQDLQPDELRKLGHNLQAIWDRFKSALPGDPLERFDQVIAALNRFEAIRYPERILSDGMFTTISLVGPPPDMEPSGPHGPMPEYHLVLKDVDALVEVIFTSAKVNPGFFTAMLKPGAIHYLTENNQHLSR